jgi:hypothetical protein
MDGAPSVISVYLYCPEIGDIACKMGAMNFVNGMKKLRRDAGWAQVDRTEGHAAGREQGVRKGRTISLFDMVTMLLHSSGFRWMDRGV